MAVSKAAAPTVQDVARAAGVSTATVSRALNLPDNVRPALRGKVLAAVERLGYVAHAGARAMSLRRSGTVGVVVPTIDNAIFARGLQAFQSRLAQAGQVVLLAFSDYDPAQEEAQVQALLARGVDALALTGVSQRPELLVRLAQRGLPWVHTGAFPAPAGAACVGFRNREAMARAVQYLLDLGHRRFGMVAGITAHNDRAADRVAGVQGALAGAGLRLAPRHLAESAYTVAEARAATRRVLLASAAGTRPTALLCGNDVLAFGAMLECAAQGLAVPSDVSVVGFDDLDLAREWTPGLTTVHVPTETMWTLAADYLLARLSDGQVEPLQREIGVELVVRGSTARVSRGAPKLPPEARAAQAPPPRSATQARNGRTVITSK